MHDAINEIQRRKVGERTGFCDEPFGARDGREKSWSDRGAGTASQYLHAFDPTAEPCVQSVCVTGRAPSAGRAEPT